MENSNSKILTLSFMTLGLIAGIIVNVLVETLTAVSTGALAKMITTDVVKHGLPVLAGLAVFSALQFNSTSRNFGEDVVVELKRVVWPSQKDTTSMTLLVIIMVVVSGIAIGLLDTASAAVIDWLLHLNFSAILG